MYIFTYFYFLFASQVSFMIPDDCLPKVDIEQIKEKRDVHQANHQARNPKSNYRTEQRREMLLENRSWEIMLRDHRGCRPNHVSRSIFGITNPLRKKGIAMDAIIPTFCLALHIPISTICFVTTDQTNNPSCHDSNLIFRSFLPL